MMTDAIKLRNSCWRNTLAGCVRFNVLLKQAKISKGVKNGFEIRISVEKLAPLLLIQAAFMIFWKHIGP